MKQLWLEMIENLGCSKSVRVIYIYITVLGQTDFEHAIFSIISSQSCFIEMDLLQKMFILLGHEKNVIHSNWWTIPLSGSVIKLFEQSLSSLLNSFNLFLSYRFEYECY